MKKLALFLGLVCSSAFAFAVQGAPLMNIDFTAVLNAAFSIKTGVAAVGQSGADFWNIYSRDNGVGGFRQGGLIFDLRDADGVATTADLAVDNAAGAWFTNASDPMLNSYLYPLSGGQDISVRLSQLAPGIYSFYVYAHGFPAGENGVIELSCDGVNYGILSTVIAADWTTGGWQEGRQYVVFRNVRVTSGQTVQILSHRGSSNLAVINGVQILKTDSLPPFPSILSNPQSATVNAGGSVTFSVSASGTAPLSYQWLFNGLVISGATGSSLSFNGVQASNSGSYSVRVSDSGGSVTSASAVLTVITPPVIIAPPASRTVVTGNGTTFSVSASGTGPFSYQWFFNGVVISGATDSSLTLNNVRRSSTGVYFVTVSNAAGAVVSAGATLTVLPPVDFVHRELPAGYAPGFKITVKLQADPSSGVTAYAIEESPPSGWSVGAVDGGYYDTATRKVKFGPFFDLTTRTLSYEVTPPDGDSGLKIFTGNVSVDGLSASIGGAAGIGVLLLLHPADRSPADSRMTIDEVTAYASAWRKGAAWPVAPSPVPIDYLTRAGTLWKNGEDYRFDPGVATAPLWWVNAPRAAATVTLANLPPGFSSSTRAVPGLFGFKEPFTVRISVHPASGVSVYAVEDRIPAGWTATGAGQGGEFDAAHGVVRFGPFFDNVARDLEYRVMPDKAVSGPVTFQGVASFDGGNVPVVGVETIKPLTRIHSLRPLAGGQFELSLEGQQGVRYEIRATSNLTDWLTLTSVTNVNGVVVFSDPMAFSEDRRFYQPVLMPAQP